MRLLLVLAVVVAVVPVVRSPRHRVTIRSALVAIGFAGVDFGTLQRQVLVAASRCRYVAVNGTVRLPDRFTVTLAVADRHLVEHVAESFVADIADVLAADAEEGGWVVAGPVRFDLTYADDVRSGTVVVEPAHGPAILGARDRRAAGPLHRESPPSEPAHATAVPSAPLRTAAWAPLRLRRADGVTVDVGTDAPSAVIGRDDGADLTVDDPAVSARHATLERDGAAWTITDLGSTNGTFVDDRRVYGTTALAPGAVLGFGPTVRMTVVGP